MAWVPTLNIRLVSKVQGMYTADFNRIPNQLRMKGMGPGTWGSGFHQSETRRAEAPSI